RRKPGPVLLSALFEVSLLLLEESISTKPSAVELALLLVRVLLEEEASLKPAPPRVAVFPTSLLLEELSREKSANPNPFTLQFLTVTPVLAVRSIPLYELAVPLIVCPAQLRTMPLVPILSPLCGQWRMLALRVVEAVIVAPHAGVAAYAGAGRKISAETRMVA